MKYQLISISVLVFLLLVSCKPKKENNQKEKEYTFINNQFDILKVFVKDDTLDNVTKKHFRYRYSNIFEEEETLIRYKGSKDTFLEINPDYTILLEKGVGLRANSILRFNFDDGFLHQTWYTYEHSKKEYLQYEPLNMKEIKLENIYYENQDTLYCFSINDESNLTVELTYDQNLNLKKVKHYYFRTDRYTKEYKLVQ